MDFTGDICEDKGKINEISMLGNCNGKILKYLFLVHPCDKAESPCKNNGLCKKDGDCFTCDCSEDWTGDICEIKGFYSFRFLNFH